MMNFVIRWGILGSVVALPMGAVEVPPAYRLLTLSEAEAVKKGEMWADAKARYPDQSWPAAAPAAIEAWKDLRFGLMIDWGPVALTEREHSWSRDDPTPAAVYDALPQRFNPTKFDARAWMALAKRAGIRYVVPIAKHHDGFCMWPSAFTDYTIAHTPFRRDIIGELATACRAEGMQFGVYVSVPDWHYPAFPWTGKSGLGLKTSYDWAAFDHFTHEQIRELMTAYGPLVTVWFDKPDQYLGRGAPLIRRMRALQPDILVNNRSGNGGDYRTPEQNLGAFDNERPWESCLTTSAHHHWSWAGPHDGAKAKEQCLTMLVSVVGGGGNVLLNVGPTPEGDIPPEQAAVLEYLGAWLSRHGEAIYATRGGPYKNTQELASTYRGNTVYLQVMRWGATDRVTLPVLPRRIVKASLLTGGAVTVETTATTMEVIVPVPAREPVVTVVKLELDGPAQTIAPLTIPGGTPMEAKPWPVDWESGLTNVGDQIEREERAAGAK